MEGLNILGSKEKEKEVEDNSPPDYFHWKIANQLREENKSHSFPSSRDKGSSLYHDASSKDKWKRKTPEVFDDYIDSALFDDISSQIVYSDMELEFCSYVTGRSDDKEELLEVEYKCKWSWCLMHRIFNISRSDSPIFPLINEYLIAKLALPPENKLKCLHKCNIIAYPNTQTIKENLMYHDYHWNVNTAILFLNNCDGYVKFQDGTKINAVQNRLVLFDGSKPHCLSTTTNEKLMYTINLNFL